MERVLEIYNELTGVFNSVDTFYAYYNHHLAGKPPKRWGKELERKIFEIHTYLKGAFAGKVQSDTVLLWLNKIAMLKEGSEAIAYRVDMNLREYKAYADLPEAIFREEVIDEDMRKTGKSYEELEPIYLKRIEKEINFLSSVRPYSDIGLEVVSRSLKRMKSKFDPIIKPGGIGSSSVGEIGIKSRANRLEKDRAIGKRKIMPPPVGMASISTFDLLNKKVYLPSLHERLVAYPGFLEKGTRDQFEKLFNGKVESFTLEWKGQKNQLSYFVQQLIKRQVIHKYPAWMTVQKHFTIKGNPIGPNLSRADYIGKEAKKRVDAVLSIIPVSTTK